MWSASIGRRRLIVALGLATMGLGGCASESSNTDLHPEGPPEVLQTVVFQRDAADEAIPVLAFGTHPDFPEMLGNVSDAVAFSFYDAANDVVVGQQVRLVFDELLKGSAVESFKCACTEVPPGSPAGTQPVCPNGSDVSNDPFNCSSCDDNPQTTQVNETGKCLDLNGDHTPDDAVLNPDLVTITCGSQTWSNTADEGYYNPSGNQLVPVLEGLLGLGPALVLMPSALRPGEKS